MKKVKIKVPAKINLTLDVVGKNGDYHDIKSLAAPVDLYDEIIVKKREDHRISLTEKSGQSGCSVQKNNACRAASAFMKKYGTTGVDIKLKKHIPLGAGLGGSSADIVGVIVAMSKLYGIKDDFTELALSLGSDAGFMLRGGYSLITGRGDEIKHLKCKKKLNVLVVYNPVQIKAGECYAEYDAMIESGEIEKSNECTDAAIEKLLAGDVVGFAENIKNDLYKPARKFCSDMREAIKDLDHVGASASIMTGSGSAVFGVFTSTAKMGKAYQRLYPIYAERVLPCKTIISKKSYKISRFF